VSKKQLKLDLKFTGKRSPVVEHKGSRSLRLQDHENEGRRKLKGGR
jgi:hypothetical protein